VQAFHPASLERKEGRWSTKNETRPSLRLCQQLITKDPAALTQGTTCALAHFWSNLKQLSL
jgi:hypothetical protein